MGALAEQPKYTTVIEVVAIAKQKEGRKTVGVKGATEHGELWVNFYADKAATLERGERYEIQYQGDLKLVTSFKHITPHGHQATGNEAPRTPQQGNGKKMDTQNYFRPTSPRDAERMFVCSTLNAFIQTGRVPNEVPALVSYVTALRDVWQQTFGADDLPAG